MHGPMCRAAMAQVSDADAMSIVHTHMLLLGLMAVLMAILMVRMRARDRHGRLLWPFDRNLSLGSWINVWHALGLLTFLRYIAA